MRGVNVAWAPEGMGATCLEALAGGAVGPGEVLVDRSLALDRLYGHWDLVGRLYRESCATVGREVRVQSSDRPPACVGRAVGHRRRRPLVVRTADGPQWSTGGLVTGGRRRRDPCEAGARAPARRANPGPPSQCGQRAHLMKALVLSGGAGRGCGRSPTLAAKQLVPVANKPVLFYGLEAIAAAGVEQVGIVVGDTAAEIKAAVGDGSRWGLEVTYLQQEAPLGLAHAVLIARDFLGDDDFVMYLGDNLLQQDLGDFVGRFEAQRARATAPRLGEEGLVVPSAQILLAHVEDPQRFGVAELDSAGRVLRLVEKPTVPPSDLALVGVYLFDRRIHEAVASIKPSGRGELEITDAIQWLIDAGHVVLSEILAGWWIDTGKLTPLLEANRLLLEGIERRIEGEVDAECQLDGRVIVEAGARLVRSHVRGRAIVGAGSEDRRTASSGPSAPSARGAWSTIPRSSTPSWSVRPG